MEGSIRKRGKRSYELTIELGRGADGERLRKYESVKGTKAQAQQKLRELLALTDKGIPVGSQKIIFSEWLTKWMTDYVVPNTRQKTIERYEGLIRKHISPVLGHIDLTKVSPSDIQGLEAKLSGDGMAPQGVQLVHNVISGAYKYALRMETAWRNPAKNVTPPKITRTEVEPPDTARVKKILNLAEGQSHPFYACIHLLAYTGLRRGEALALRHQDLNLETGNISVVQSLGRSLHKGLVFEPTKTQAGRRSIDIDEETVAVLRAHIGKQLLFQLESEGSYQEGGLLFADPLGRPFNPMSLTRAFQSLAKQAGVFGAKLHDLRHFHASLMLQNGGSLLLVSKRLGHASISTTGDVYGHLMPGWQKEAANAFAEAMRKG